MLSGVGRPTCETVVGSHKVDIARQVGPLRAHRAYVLLDGSMRPAFVEGHRQMQHPHWQNHIPCLQGSVLGGLLGW